MDEEKYSTNNVKDPDEELTKAMTEKVLESLVDRGIPVPFIYADGTIKYQIANKFNCLATANRRRRD